MPQTPECQRQAARASLATCTQLHTSVQYSEPIIASITLATKDKPILEDESAGYVPVEEASGDSELEVLDDNSHYAVQGCGALALDEVQSEQGSQMLEDAADLDEPDVIPLQVNGSADVDLTKLSANELMA
ncbi:hypothetical protein BDZ97DRAFT_1923553 [Flammula alnicola]|nr:hypothetical protein BDZ97DRAFT_1923553 [Flammula alnicola]